MLVKVGALVRIGLLGAVGGAVNAWLCYAQIPEPVRTRGATFEWHVIPAGGAHGAVLAILAVASAALLTTRPIYQRVLAAPVVGWLSGYLSWVPLHVSVFGETVRHAITWPSQQQSGLELLYVPFIYFGLAAVVFCLLSTRKVLSSDRIATHLVVGILGGVIGSLLWWISWQPWYFSPIHGTIWGVLVGYGLHKDRKALQGVWG